MAIFLLFKRISYFNMLSFYVKLDFLFVFISGIAKLKAAKKLLAYLIVFIRNPFFNR